MTVLAVASEGCAENLRKRLADVLPLVLRGLQVRVCRRGLMACGWLGDSMHGWHTACILLGMAVIVFRHRMGFEMGELCKA